MPAINIGNGYVVDDGYVTCTAATATATTSISGLSGTWGRSIVGNGYLPNQWFVPGENPCGEIALNDIQECKLPVPLPEEEGDLERILRDRYSFFKKKIVNEVYIEEEE